MKNSQPVAHLFHEICSATRRCRKGQAAKVNRFGSSNFQRLQDLVDIMYRHPRWCDNGTECVRLDQFAYRVARSQHMHWRDFAKQEAISLAKEVRQGGLNWIGFSADPCSAYRKLEKLCHAYHLNWSEVGISSQEGMQWNSRACIDADIIADR